MDMAAFDNNIWNDYYSFYESEINCRNLPTHIHKDSFREMFLNNVLDLIYEDMSYPLALARTRLRVTEVLNFITDVYGPTKGITMKKGQCLGYEWVLWFLDENMDDETYAYLNTKDESYANAVAWGEDHNRPFLYTELRRRVWDIPEEDGGEGVLDETCVFVENGEIAEFFENGIKVPKRFRDEVAAFHKGEPKEERVTRLEAYFKI
jgi:hypothetical protein